VIPSLAGFGDKVREQLAKEDLSVSAQVKPDVDTSKAAAAGAEYGGAFGASARKGIESALKDLPNPKIDADSSPAERKIADLRGQLEELRDKKIGVDISSADFVAKIAEIKSALEDIAKDKKVDIAVRADAAAAFTDLAAVNAEADKLDGKDVRMRVTDDGSAKQSTNDIGALMLAGVSLGPAIIPVAAAVAAALGAIGVGAIAGIAALGVVKLGFSGIGTAVSALNTAQTQQGQNAAQLASQQISSANSVASAQDGVKSAVQGVADAQRSAKDANVQAADQVANAQRSLQDAYISTGISIQGALDAQSRAEETLAGAQQQEQLAQESLTLARQAAQRQIESLTLSVADGALAERQAQLNIEQAKQNLDKTLANPTATKLQRDQSQLAYDQSVQQLTDVQARNKNLQQDQQAAVKAGVDGSQQVQAAQRGVTSATQATADAQKGLQQATANVAEARRAGAEKITVAEKTLADAQAKQAETAVVGAESVAKAQQGVVAAQRSLQNALASQAAQAASASQSASKLQQALAALSPAGQEFARFLAGLKPQLDSLKATAQAGLLPGVELGIKSLLPLMPEFTTLIKSVSVALGDMAARTGAALNSPFWRGFFDFVNGEAAPSLRIFGQVLGNLATGFAGLLVAFKPVWDQMGQGMLGLSQRFADFGKTAGQNSAFQQFLAYVKTEGPVVVRTFGDLFVVLVDIGRALGPLGGVVLGIVDDLAKIVAAIPPGWLAVIVPGLWGMYEAWKAVQLVMLGYKALSIVGENGKVIESFGKVTNAISAVKGAGVWILETGKAAVSAALDVGVLALAWIRAGAAAVASAVKDAAAGLLAVGSAAASAALDVGALALAWVRVGIESAISGAVFLATALAEGVVSAATAVWTAAQWLLNAALDANPIGIVILAIGALVAIVILVAKNFDFFKGIVIACWDGIKIASQAAWDYVLHPIFNFITEVIKGVGDVFVWLWHNVVEPVWAGIKVVFDALMGGVHAIADSFNWAIGVIQTAWNKLGDIAKAPVNFVIDMVYNHGIVPVWNGIAGVFGLGQLQPAALLAEGGVIPGYAPGVDTVPALLSRGEGILVPEAVRGLGADFVYAANTHFSGGRASGGPGFADGGIVGAVGGAVSSAWDSISGVFTDPVGTVKKLFAGVTGAVNGVPGSGLLHQALIGIPGKVIDAVIAKAKDLVASIGSTLTGGGPAALDGWITTALNLMGMPLTYLPGIHSLVMHESGGNPNAINLTDSNAAAGHPSQGLMQTIPGTYAAYVLPSLANLPITNPISNITAGVRYAMANYGPAMLMAGGRHDASGNYIGYDSGGWLPPGLTLAYNGTGQHERVLTAPQFQALNGAAAGGSQRPVTVNVYPRPEHSEADIADMVSRRLAFTMRAAT
jgi:hypothetical protein